VAQGPPKGSQRQPKGAQREPKGTPKGAKGSPRAPQRDKIHEMHVSKIQGRVFAEAAEVPQAAATQTHRAGIFHLKKVKILKMDSPKGDYTRREGRVFFTSKKSKS